MTFVVRARVISAAVLALLVAFAPVANDLCARSCESQVDQACPAHAPKPEPPCARNHGVMSADLPRALSSSTGPSGPHDAIVVSVALTVQIVSTDLTPTRLLHSPPPLTEPLPALRI